MRKAKTRPLKRRKSDAKFGGDTQRLAASNRKRSQAPKGSNSVAITI